jgi:hypothetical protein
MEEKEFTIILLSFYCANDIFQSIAESHYKGTAHGCRGCGEYFLCKAGGGGREA